VAEFVEKRHDELDGVQCHVAEGDVVLEQKIGDAESDDGPDSIFSHRGTA
jgi:hypothetical protein